MSRFQFTSALGLILLVASGCTTIVTPPAHVSDPVTVYLTDYGRHSSIMLPSSPGQYTEYAFGDWQFFALGNRHWWTAIEAIVHSPQSTLGRRDVTMPDDPQQLRKQLGCQRLMNFQVDRLRAQVLRENLERTFRISTTQPIHSNYSRLNHVPDDETYWGLHNCNHVTAEWLRQLGCDVQGPAILSTFHLKPVESE